MGEETKRFESALSGLPAVPIISLASEAEPSGQEIKLFNGRDLSGWECFVPDSNAGDMYSFPRFTISGDEERFSEIGVPGWRLGKLNTNPLKCVSCSMARDGIEPPTRGFSVPCSTN